MTTMYQRTERAVTEVTPGDAEPHLGLVYTMVRKMFWAGEDYKELVQVGSLALLRATYKFRPEEGTAFSTYAMRAIRNAILRHRQFNGRMCRDGSRTVSLTDGVAMWEGRRDAPGRMEDDDARRDTCDRAASMLAVLDNRSAELLLRRAEGHTLDAIAASMGVHREAVRKIEIEAMRTVRKAHGLADTGTSFGMADREARSRSLRRGWTVRRENQEQWRAQAWGR